MDGEFPDGRSGSLGYVNGLGFVLIAIAAWPMVPFGATLAHRLDAKLLRTHISEYSLALVALNMIRESGVVLVAQQQGVGRRFDFLQAVPDRSCPASDVAQTLFDNKRFDIS